jgi:hypothetical protein
LAVEILCGSLMKKGEILLLAFALSLANLSLSWAYFYFKRFRQETYFRHNLEKFVLISKSPTEFLTYAMNIYLFYSVNLYLNQKMVSKRKILCMIDPKYYAIFNMKRNLPVINMYCAENYRQIINVLSILQKYNESYMIRTTYTASFVFTINSI